MFHISALEFMPRHQYAINSSVHLTACICNEAYPAHAWFLNVVAGQHVIGSSPQSLPLHFEDCFQLHATM